jgi:hypothetical protein
MYAGIGLGLAELGASVLTWAEERHALDAGFAIDGYAFHLALGAPDEHLDGRPPPPEFTGPAGRLFDHGLARSTWFTCGADPSSGRIGDRALSPPIGGRTSGAASGWPPPTPVGWTPRGWPSCAACRDTRPPWPGARRWPAYGRVLAGNVVPGNEVAANMALTGLSTTEVSDLVGSCRAAAGTDVSLEAFVRWHDAIRHKFADL